MFENSSQPASQKNILEKEIPVQEPDAEIKPGREEWDEKIKGQFQLDKDLSCFTKLKRFQEKREMSFADDIFTETSEERYPPHVRF